MEYITGIKHKKIGPFVLFVKILCTTICSGLMLYFCYAYTKTQYKKSTPGILLIIDLLLVMPLYILHIYDFVLYYKFYGQTIGTRLWSTRLLSNIPLINNDRYVSIMFHIYTICHIIGIYFGIISLPIESKKCIYDAYLCNVLQAISILTLLDICLHPAQTLFGIKGLLLAFVGKYKRFNEELNVQMDKTNILVSTCGGCCICDRHLSSLTQKLIKCQPCGHLFHQKCGESYTKIYNKCPICDENFTSFENIYAKQENYANNPEYKTEEEFIQSNDIIIDIPYLVYKRELLISGLITIVLTPLLIFFWYGYYHLAMNDSNINKLKIAFIMHNILFSCFYIHITTTFITHAYMYNVTIDIHDAPQFYIMNHSPFLYFSFGIIGSILDGLYLCGFTIPFSKTTNQIPLISSYVLRTISTISLTISCFIGFLIISLFLLGLYFRNYRPEFSYSSLTQKLIDMFPETNPNEEDICPVCLGHASEELEKLENLENDNSTNIFDLEQNSEKTVVEEGNDKWVKLNCGHVLHKKCADLWLLKHEKCPCCQKRPDPTKDFIELYKIQPIVQNDIDDIIVQNDINIITAS
jgi:hypothetical protein